jgi:hypothetical protein
MSQDYRGVPLPTTPEGKARADKTLRAVYGTRVKIPPPGKEREELCDALSSLMCDSSEYALMLGPEEIDEVLRALEEELG